MQELLERRTRHEVITYVWEFVDKDNRGSGFAFPCDAEGNIAKLTPEGQENLRKCLNGEHNTEDMGVVMQRHTYYTPAVIRCHCRRRVELESSWANRCACGTEYNGCGQALAPRRYWGEETGERFSEVR